MLLKSESVGVSKSGAGIAAETQQDRPNIVIIYGDDVGYSDVGAYGSRLIPTPNIDRLASQGLRFTDGHCSAATCTPAPKAALCSNSTAGRSVKASIRPPRS